MTTIDARTDVRERHPGALSVEVITTEHGLEALGPEWSALVRASGGHWVFLTWEWMRTWWAHFNHGQRLFVLAARDEAGVLVGIAPLKIARRTYRGVPFRQLEFIGHGPELAADYLDVITAPAHRNAVFRAFAGAIADARDAWDVIFLADVLETSPTLDWSEALAEANGWRHERREGFRCPYLELPSTWDAFLRSLSANMREHVRRRGNALERRHGGRLRLVRSGPDVASGMEALFRLHGARWRTRGEVGSFDRHAHSRAFHQDLARRFVEADWLRLYLLEADGQAVAALCAYEYGGRLAYYQAGFDPAWAKLSVGSVLMALIIKDCIARGVPEFDFLRGDEDYKYRWTRSERRTRQMRVWNHSVRGLAHHAQVRVIGVLKRAHGVLSMVTARRGRPAAGLPAVGASEEEAPR
jgi:CelD/BcsL family acetyltransferase involved in cellulose biosynthesis